MDSHRITYRYSLPDGSHAQFDLEFEEPGFRLVNRIGERPDWTALDTHKCKNCPLEAADSPHCPLALALLGPVSHFADVLSYTELAVEVHTEERRIGMEGQAQDMIAPMLGLLSATSGCPHTAPFRPMARFHLPFANEAETVYRAASMYLLGQYFRARDGKAVDQDLSGLLDIYRNIEAVNLGMAHRLRLAAKEDSTVNAIVLLDLFAKTLPVAVEDSLDELRPLFESYT